MKMLLFSFELHFATNEGREMSEDILNTQTLQKGIGSLVAKLTSHLYS